MVRVVVVVVFTLCTTRRFACAVMMVVVVDDGVDVDGVVGLTRAFPLSPPLLLLLFPTAAAPNAAAPTPPTPPTPPTTPQRSWEELPRPTPTPSGRRGLECTTLLV